MQARRPAPAGPVVAAFLMTLSSAFGQTYFIALFAPWLKAELGLTDGTFGGLYTLANVASAAVLIWAGGLADRFRIRWLAVVVLLGLAVCCAAMASNTSVILLLPILFGLRLFGQGSLGHLSMTGVGRWYERRRGRMMSLAVLGLPASEAALPIVAVALIGTLGWRPTWLVAAAALCLVSVPLVLVFLRNEPPTQRISRNFATERRHGQWTRAEVLRRPEFFLLLSGVIAPSFVMTAVFFHQVYLVEVKGWTLDWFVSWFPAFAGVSVLAALLTGAIIDRLDARRLLPLFLLPMAGGVLVLCLFDSRYAVPAFMVLGAITNGSAKTLLGAIWAELFGTRHLGAIRSLAFGVQVFASALAPGLIGVLLDLGVSLELQYLAMSIYATAASLTLWLLLPSLYRLSPS